MAPPKKKTGKGESAKYYAADPEAKKKKDALTKKINARPEQKAKRRELGKANYKADKANGGSKSHRKDKDLSHTKNGLVYKDSSTNRSSSTDSAGDRRARGRKRTKKK